MTKHHFKLLALGDSYTIGECVALHESFPYQVLQLLRNKNLHFNAPEIIAKTGWTTFELAEHILHTKLNEHYDFVTLLIGVNNQYRELSTEDYTTDFEFLLKKAIHFAGEKNERVIVLSIPDWGATAFAKDRDGKKIAEEIDVFNAINKNISLLHKVHYVEITESTRKAVDESSLLAADGLHYSAKEHAKWAKEVANIIESLIR